MHLGTLFETLPFICAMTIHVQFVCLEGCDFHYSWHVKWVWEKHVRMKMKDNGFESIILQHLGDIMYKNNGHVGLEVEHLAMAKLITLSLL